MEKPPLPSISQRRPPAVRTALLALSSVCLSLAICRPALAQTLATTTTLHDFPGAGGDYPQAPLTLGADGNFYGTTASSATTGGTVFKITADGTLTTLHTFSSHTEGSLGASPLLLAKDGNLYGLAQYSGLHDGGTAFKITPAGALTILYSFSGGTGLAPFGGLVQDADGNFYGTAEPSSAGTCTLFRLSPHGDLSILHTFDKNTEGFRVSSSLIIGSDGNFYGTANLGGVYGYGTVFKVTPAGALTVLHSFNDRDGSYPVAALVQGSDGNFYGTTSVGGTQHDGTAFVVTPAGDFTTLYNFRGSDGRTPQGTLVQGPDGNFYGTTLEGGGGYGSVFQMTPAGTVTTLSNFFKSNGANPFTGLAQGRDGSYYGTTTGIGNEGGSTVFKVTVTGTSPSVFFSREVPLADGVYYLPFASGRYFGYYSFLSDPHYVYHFDLGYEYIFDAADGRDGVYLYDFESGDFFYTSPTFPFPYLYDFGLQAVLYYYPDPKNTGRYNTNGVRYFYSFATGKIITK